jgi:hypothetical protein
MTNEQKVLLLLHALGQVAHCISLKGMGLLVRAQRTLVSVSEEDARRGKPLPLDLAERWHRMRIEQAGIVLPAYADAVAQWRAHIVTLCEQLRVKVRWEPAAAGINAYAWAKRKEIEIPPVTGPGSYCVALHEIGHCRHPCDHQRVDDVLKESVCVRCELLAWSFASREAQPHWSREMHTRMTQAVTTYERYASHAERDEIRAMTSQLGFCQIRQERITRGAY